MDFRKIMILSLILSLSVVAKCEKVKLELFYESLCPYCTNFIVNYLPQIFQNGLISAVDLKLSPCGNARVSPDGSITCQHGEKECLLNSIEACAIDAWPDVELELILCPIISQVMKYPPMPAFNLEGIEILNMMERIWRIFKGTHFSFIHCVESMIFNNKFSQWETCFDSLGLPQKQIDMCYSSGRGKKLEFGYAQETAALKPPHQYVPWVVVDGTPLYDNYENFMSYICEAYRGSSRPKACNRLPVINAGQDSYQEKFSRTGKVYSSKYDASLIAGKFAQSKIIQVKSMGGKAM